MFPRFFRSKKLLALVISLVAVLVAGTWQFAYSKFGSTKSVFSQKVADQNGFNGFSFINIPRQIISRVASVSGEVKGAQTTNQMKSQLTTSSKVTFGVVPQDYTNKSGELTSLQQNLGMKISTVSIFKQFGLAGNNNFDAAGLAYEKSQGMNVQLAWEPWNPEKGSTQSVDYLKEISKGTYDSYIKSFALAMKQYGGQVTLRFGHEMNGDWYPWGNRPVDYIAAYKHVHDLVKGVGASNVAFMWCVNETGNPSSLTQFYPGDGYVDVIGIDGFNWGTTQNYGGWKSFADIFGGDYQYLAGHYNKPIVIAETGSTEFGGNKAQWISDMFSVLPSKFPKVKGVVWFDLLKETDWRIDSSKSSLQAFQKYFKN